MYMCVCIRACYVTDRFLFCTPHAVCLDYKMIKVFYILFCLLIYHSLAALGFHWFLTSGTPPTSQMRKLQSHSLPECRQCLEKCCAKII